MSEDEFVFRPVPADENDPQIQAALAELKQRILERFPDTTFTVSLGEDPIGIYLYPEVDIEDLDQVRQPITERLVDMQVEEGLPIHVVPEWPPERSRAYREQQAALAAEQRLATTAS